MVMCEKCNKEFPFPWKLRRHLARKKPCDDSTKTANESSTTGNASSTTGNASSTTGNASSTTGNASSTTGNASSTTGNASSDVKKVPSGNDTLECKYCNKSFTRKYGKNQHESICTFRDEIWELEEECDIEHNVFNIKNHECKYCNKEFCRANNLHRHLHSGNCKAKEEYKEYLEKKILEKKAKHTNATQVANTINNNNTNIEKAVIVINSIGKENVEHITLEKIKEIMSKIITEKYPGDNNVYKLSAETVANVQKLIREKEENRNIVIPHERRQVVSIKRGEDFESEDIHEALDESFRNTSRHIVNIGKDATWKRKKVEKMYKCVNSFEKKGFRGHPEMPDTSNRKYVHRREDVRNAQRKMKIANMLGENDEEDDNEC